MHYKVYACCDVGRVRENNEDNLYVCGAVRADVELKHIELDGSYEAGPLLFAVCDGMGGEENGELASLAAVKALTVDAEADAYDEARRNVCAANEAVLKIQGDGQSKRAGTTIAAFSIREDTGLAYNLGDSRVYLYRAGLRRLSKDHSMTECLVELGVLTEEQAWTDRNRNVLTTFLGMRFEGETEPYFADKLALADGDVILLCSDGLCGYVRDAEIEAAIGLGGDSKDVCTRLMDKALMAGGSDNITIIAIKAEK